MITADAEASVDENASGEALVSVETENATEVTVDNDNFEIADGNLKLKDDVSLDFEADGPSVEVTITASGEGDRLPPTQSPSRLMTWTKLRRRRSCATAH